MGLACSKPKDIGGWRELWYSALFCDFVREHDEGKDTRKLFFGTKVTTLNLGKLCGLR